MHRNRDLIRQWTLLQAMARSRHCTISKLAADVDVSTRTIRRDLNALQEAGFPIYDDGPDGGSKAWRLETRSLGALARSGLTFSELCALYYSRALIECFAGSHVLADVQSALHKFEAALSPQMRKFLDRLPGVVTAKPRGAKRQDATTYGVIAKLLEAILHQRVVAMRYYSAANGREKDYTMHPHRLVHAQGGLYLWGLVPAYGELRTFAVGRIRRVAPGGDVHARRRARRRPVQALDGRVSNRRIGDESHPAPLPPAAGALHPRALVAPVAAAQGQGRRLGGADHGRLRRLHAAKLDPQLRARGARAGALGSRGVGRG